MMRINLIQTQFFQVKGKCVDLTSYQPHEAVTIMPCEMIKLTSIIESRFNELTTDSQKIDFTDLYDDISLNRQTYCIGNDALMSEDKSCLMAKLNLGKTIFFTRDPSTDSFHHPTIQSSSVELDFREHDFFKNNITSQDINDYKIYIKVPSRSERSDEGAYQLVRGFSKPQSCPTIDFNPDILQYNHNLSEETSNNTEQLPLIVTSNPLDLKFSERHP